MIFGFWPYGITFSLLVQGQTRICHINCDMVHTRIDSCLNICSSPRACCTKNNIPSKAVPGYSKPARHAHHHSNGLPPQDSILQVYDRSSRKISVRNHAGLRSNPNVHSTSPSSLVDTSARYRLNPFICSNSQALDRHSDHGSATTGIAKSSSSRSLGVQGEGVKDLRTLG